MPLKLHFVNFYTDRYYLNFKTVSLNFVAYAVISLIIKFYSVTHAIIGMLLQGVRVGLSMKVNNVMYYWLRADSYTYGHKRQPYSLLKIFL